MGHVGEKRNVFRVLVGKSEDERSLGRPRLRWENINIHLKNIEEIHGLYSSVSGQGRVTGYCECNYELSGRP